MANNIYKVNFQITFYDVEEGFDTTEAIKEELTDKVYTVAAGEVSEEDEGWTIDDFASVEIIAEKDQSLVEIAQEVKASVDSANEWFSITDSEDNLIYEEE